jgi:hypothetical protein
MQRHIISLILPMFLACSGKNVVSGDDTPTPRQLLDSLPAWCEKTCQRIAACQEGQDCDCAGDTCSCVGSDEDCRQDCMDALGEYTGSDECAVIGQSYKTCIDGLTCSEFDQEPACAPTDQQTEMCEGEDGDPPPSTGSGGSANVDYPPAAEGGQGNASSGGTTSYAGTTAYAGTTGYAGTASGGTGAVGPVVSCEEGGGWGGTSGGEPGTAQVTCSEARSGCSDNREYSWICVDDAQGHNWCTCFVDGDPLGALEPTAVCPIVAELNAACAWNLAN